MENPGILPLLRDNFHPKDHKRDAICQGLNCASLFAAVGKNERTLENFTEEVGCFVYQVKGYFKSCKVQKCSKKTPSDDDFECLQMRAD